MLFTNKQLRYGIHVCSFQCEYIYARIQGEVHVFPNQKQIHQVVALHRRHFYDMN